MPDDQTRPHICIFGPYFFSALDHGVSEGTMTVPPYI